MNAFAPLLQFSDKTGIAATLDWFKKAVESPTDGNVHTQLGCHLEEVAEMIETLTAQDRETRGLMISAIFHITKLAEHLKGAEDKIVIHAGDRTEFLDAICDQIVTAVGCAHMSGMDVVGGLDEVNRSNFSKFDDQGNPIFGPNLKIQKGPNYSAADLTSFAV